MRIVMVGAGYVGLVSGACLADFGHEVVCVEVDENKVASLREGRVPIYEPGLSELALANQAAGRLSFTTSLKEAGRGAQAIFIAVGTPSLAEVGSADMHFVHDAARAIGEIIEDFTVVVVKSTVPIGAGDEVERIIAKHAPQGSFAVVSNPEFLREGAAIEDFKRPDRVVIGVEDDRAREVMREIYGPIERNGGRIVYTSRRSSEMIKYAANVFLAMKVTFINEIADLCERLGADVLDVSHGIGLDDRIGRKFLNPGPGFGGSCFPKDTLALTKLAADAKAPIRLVETLVDVNDKRKTAMAAKIVKACGGSVAGKRIAVLGLTYKPRTDDMRDAPSLVILPELQAAGARHRRLRSGRRSNRETPAARRRVRRQRLCVPEGRGRCGHRHRVGRVPRPRSCSRQGQLDHADHRRLAQYLPDRNDEGAWISLCLRRPGVRRGRLTHGHCLAAHGAIVARDLAA